MFGWMQPSAWLNRGNIWKKNPSFFVSGHPNLRSTAEEILVSAKKAEAKVMTESDR